MVRKSVKIIMAVMLLSLAMVYGATTALVPSIANLEFTMISQDPDPVEPGSVVDLRWKIENTGAKASDDVMVELLDEYPLTLYSGDQIKDIGVIQARQTGDRGVIVLFKVRVDEKAIEGVNEVTLRYKTKQTGWVELDPFDVNIQTTDATLSVEEVKVDPEIVAPGEVAKVTLNVKNLADSFLKDISLQLDVSSDDIPLAPTQSSTEKRVKQISSGLSKDVVFDLIVEPDATLGVYKVPLEISFFDSQGNSYTRSDIVGVVVGDEPDLAYYIDDKTIDTTGVKGDISIKFVNKGLTDIKFLNVVLKPGDDYQILSTEEVYLGNIDSDDYESADYNLYVNAGAPKDLKLPLDITYKDANNRDYSLDTSVSLKTFASEEAQKIGVTQKSNKAGVVIVIVIVVLGLVIYKVVKRKKKK